jgi:MFS transporter, OCT family, solute carrier family 22 (organic cation transporter), member 4/5
MVGTVGFVGVASACLTLPFLSDKIGRIPVFLTTMFFQIPLLVMILTAKRIGDIYFVAFFYGIALIGRYTVGFVYTLEVLMVDKKAIGGTIFQMGDAAATIYISVYLAFVSRQTMPIIEVALVLNIVSFVSSILLMPESPAWLVSQGKFDAARSSLSWIAKVNGVSNF